jgi:serine/threonine protein kinase/tetratricopeptide (TPR) repeat protein
MHNARHRDVEIFTGAVQLPVAERTAYLDRACGGDEGLQREVLALLQAHDSGGVLLEQSPQDRLAESKLMTSLAVKTGDRIGRYKLRQQIGEGGCGVVYLAEQEEPIRRKVALKVIKPGMDTKSVIARFEAERQALALMDHPNIAKVLDAGATESGRPYFVMELVQGIKITDYCDQNSLPTRERLKLFIQVCNAVQHAHQKGVIHRDIKPSNILVATAQEDAPLPVVIDFGIAKATTNQTLTDQTHFTAFEMLVGTPAYMSPEQAELGKVDLDTRTDIYSLGVLLYELLTGSTPFETGELLKSGLDEVRNVIRTREPARPSTRLSKLTKADLTTIALRRRSEPPNLIRVMRGDLDWIVMKAMEKDRRRRYPTATGLALDVQRFLDNEAVSARPPSAQYKLQKLVLRHKWLFSGIGVITLILVVSLVLVSVSLAKERHESAKSRQVTKFLEEMLQGVEPSVARGNDTTMLKTILDQTTVRISNELTNQPDVEVELLSLAGRVYDEIRNYHEAESMHRAALALNQRLHGPDSEAVAESLDDLGADVRQEGELTNAESAVLQALVIQRKLYGDQNQHVAASLDNLANIYREERRLVEAEAVAREALAIRRNHSETEPMDTAQSLRTLAIILGDEGKRAESEATAHEVLAIRQRLFGNGDASVASAMDDLAWAEGSNGKIDEAESLEKTGLALQQAYLGDDHPDVARSLSLLGRRLQQQGKLTASEAMVNAALSIQRKVLGEDNSETLYTLVNLSSTLDGEGQWAEAEVADRAALASLRRRLGKEDPQTLAALKELIHVLGEQKKFDEAEQLLNEALTPGFEAQPASMDFLIQRADLVGRQGKWEEALADAVVLCRQPTIDPFYFHMQAVLLAKTYNLPAYKQLCATLLAKFTNTANPYVAERVVKDCLLLPNSGLDLAVVDKLADTSVTLGKGDNSGMPWFQAAKALAAYRTGRFAEAVEWAEKPLSSSEFYAKAQACAIMAMAHWQLGQKDKARAALANGDSLAPNILPAFASVDIGESWVAYLQARISLDEAAAMIGPGSPDEESSKEP